MLLMLSSTSSTSTTQWSGGAFSIDSMKVHIWIDQQLAVLATAASSAFSRCVSDSSHYLLAVNVLATADLLCLQ